MLDVNPNTVCELMELAREFHAQEQVVFPEEPEISGVEWPLQMLEAHSEDPTLDIFRSLVDDLTPDQQQQVVALLWLGRGDYSLDEWEDALTYAAEAWNEATADYLIAHPLLANHLAEGLDQHGYRCD